MIIVHQVQYCSGTPPKDAAFAPHLPPYPSAWLNHLGAEGAGAGAGAAVPSFWFRPLENREVVAFQTDPTF